MTRRLFFLLGHSPVDLVRWAIAAGPEILDYGAVDGAAGLEHVVPYGNDVAEIIALLPGEQAACRRMPTAPRSLTKLKAAAELLLEDDLAESVKTLHIGAGATPGRAVAFAAKTEIVEGWRAAFAQAGLDLDILSTDYLALPSSIAEATVLADGERVIAAFAGVGFALEAPLFRALAGDFFAEPPSVFRVIGDESLVKALPEGCAVDWQGPAKDSKVMGEFARALDAASPPNLLPARFFKQKALAEALGPWRRAAGLAAGLTALAFVTMIADSARLSRAEARWTASARDLHAQRFPEAAAEDPVAFARQRLAAGGEEASFLIVSARIADAARRREDIDILRIRFDARRGDFVLGLSGETDAAIESFKTDLGAVGVAAADSGGFRKAGEFWSGDLKVRLQ